MVDEHHPVDERVVVALRPLDEAAGALPIRASYRLMASDTRLNPSGPRFPLPSDAVCDVPGPVAALIFQMPSSASRAARWPASTAPSIYPLQALAVSVAAHLIGPIGSLSAAPKWSRPHGPVFEL